MQTEAQDIENENHEPNSYFDLDDDHTSIRSRFPEPHERLYYYVKEDEDYNGDEDEEDVGDADNEDGNDK